HRDDLDVADQDLLRRPQRPDHDGGQGAARGLRARRGRHPQRAPIRAGSGYMSDGYRVAVVGATGAVGTVMLAKLRERDFPAREIVPFASERSAGRELEGAGTVQPLSDETIQGFDL